MKEETVKQAIKQYFITMAEHGRTVSEGINPEEKLVKQELEFLPHLDDNDLFCMFCNEHLVVIVIDYRTQRPVWGCLKDRFSKGLQKIKWLNHCNDCGKELDLSPKELEYQEKYMEHDNVKTTCDICIGNGNILTDDDMGKVQKKVLAN